MQFGVMPEQILRLAPVTCAVVGDGEMVFPLLLERISRDEGFSDLPGVASIDNGVFRRNSSTVAGFSTTCPAPDYHRWLNIPAYRSLMATVPVQTKTGCRFQCVYCTYPKIEGSSCRLKEPGSIADAVARLADGRGARFAVVDGLRFVAAGFFGFAVEGVVVAIGFGLLRKMMLVLRRRVGPRRANTCLYPCL
jgi:radical SAM superfamily enzyme YgiQ (UPF0313 family)